AYAPGASSRRTSSGPATSPGSPPDPALRHPGGVIRIAHTSELQPPLLDEIWEMLVDVFEGDIEPSDWEHALGGIHALAYDDAGTLVGHASVIQRRLILGERAWRTGDVEAVGVRAEARRHGHASALMDAIERVIRGAYDLGA